MWLSSDFSANGNRRRELNEAPARSFSPRHTANEDLKRRVATFLAGKHRPALRNLSVEAENGVVTLRGKVPSFHEKQLSVQLARRVAGVVRLIDDVVVRNSHSGASAFAR
jgi:osmotically-inducible protein OsmY